MHIQFLKCLVPLVSCAFLVLSTASAQAALFVHITADVSNGASIDSEGNLREDGKNYRVIYKPTPRPEWVRVPWISPSQAYRGTNSMGMEINPTLDYTDKGTDKVNHRITSGSDSFALDFNRAKYTGFAVKLGKFDAPSKGLLIAQWWQGSPYSPPLLLGIIPSTNPSDPIRYQFQFRNNETGGNPTSLKPNTIPFHTGVDNTLNRDSWHTFVVYTRMRHAGQPDDGEVRVWHNGVEVIRWFGKIGYDPSRPPSDRDANPNSKFDVFYGPYRGQQDERHQLFFDEIRFADTFKEANPDQP